MPKATIYKLPQRYLIEVTDDEGKVLGYDFGRSDFAAGDKIANFDPKNMPNERGDVSKRFPLFEGAGPKSKRKRA